MRARCNRYTTDLRSERAHDGPVTMTMSFDSREVRDGALESGMAKGVADVSIASTRNAPLDKRSAQSNNNRVPYGKIQDLRPVPVKQYFIREDDCGAF